MKKIKVIFIFLLFLIVIFLMVFFIKCYVKEPSTQTPMPGTKSGGGWSWKKGKGDPEQLADAALAIENTKFNFQMGYGNSEYVINKLSDDLKNILEDYDVYVYSIIITSEGDWDGYDDEGNFYGSTLYEANITLAAGYNFKNVTIIVWFGVK